MKSLIVLSGPIGVGKTSFVEALAPYGVRRVSTRQHILRETGCANERRALQDAGDQLDEATGGAWVAEAIAEVPKLDDAEILVLDSARIPAQVQALRDRFGERVFHIHLYADRDILAKRYAGRRLDVREFPTYDQAAAHGTEQKVPDLAGLADSSSMGPPRRARSWRPPQWRFSVRPRGRCSARSM